MGLQIPQGVSIVGYSDNLAIIATANSERMLQIAVEHAIDTISEWMVTRKLKLTHQKQSYL